MTTNDDSALTVAEMIALLSRRRDGALVCWWLERLARKPEIEMLSVCRRQSSVRLEYRIHGCAPLTPVEATMDLPLGEFTADELAMIAVRVIPDLAGADALVSRETPPGAVERAREWLTRFWLNLPPDGDGAANG